MTPFRSTHAVAAALVATLAVAGCKKQEPAPEVAAPPPPPAMEPMTPAAPMAAAASVTGVDLGSTVGPDMQVASPSTTFGVNDTIHAVVSTQTSDPMATVPATLGVKWTYGATTVVNEESKDVNLSGKGTTDFQISKPDGWPAGSYRLEVMLDGKVVETRDFEVK